MLAGSVRRGEDFDAAEDALQEALLEALRVWPEQPPLEPRAWLTTVAKRGAYRRPPNRRRLVFAAKRRRSLEPEPAATEEGDDTLFVLFLLLPPRPHTRVTGGANSARSRWPDNARDRRRLLRS